VRLFWIFLGLGLVLLVPFFVWGEHFEQWFNREAAIDWFERFGGWAWLPGILLLCMDLVLPIPGTAVMAALGYVYGPFLGGVVSAIGSVLSGLLAYGLCRCVGKRAAIRILGEQDYIKGQVFFTRAGGWVIVLSRWMPVLPEVVACMAGLTKMSFNRFVAALICGSVPLGFTYAFVGSAGDRFPGLAFGLSLCMPPLLWVILQPWIAKLTRQRSDASN
jgi:uncharacterized membrane protein YdjX (TVP38/TMEM64 family)